jgi:hypothetical protein
MTHYYVLDGDKPVAATHNEWQAALDEGARLVAKTVLRVGEGLNVDIVTSFDGEVEDEDELPVGLFETWFFFDMDDDMQAAYATWGEAEAGHAQAVAEWRTNYPEADVVEDTRNQPPIRRMKKDQLVLGLVD